MNKTVHQIGVATALAVAWSTAVLADFPSATYSLSFDGNVTDASSILGGAALPISQSTPSASDYVSIRDSESVKAFVGSDTVQPWHENLDPFGTGSWSMLAVARGAEEANGVYWDVGWCAWQDTDPSGWCTGFSLVRLGDGSTALVRRQMGAAPQTILSARVENDTTKFHSYLVTHNPYAAGTEESPFFVLYVDGQKVAQSTTLHQVWRFGYQFCGVYGGASNAGLANGIAFAIDEIGIWQEELTAEQAAEVCANYPTWPSVTRHAAEMPADSSFSELAWNPPWEDSKASIGHVTAADGTCLTFDVTPTAYSLEIESAGDVALRLGETGGLDGVSSMNLKGVAGRLLLDATTFPLLGTFLVPDTLTARVEDANPVVPPLSDDGYLAVLNKSGQSLEVAAPLSIPETDGVRFLRIGRSEGTQNVILDEGSSLEADWMMLGAWPSASVNLVQKGGSVTLNSRDDALYVSYHALSDSGYTLLGGTCDAASGCVFMGINNTNELGFAARLTVGGGEKSATMRTRGIWSRPYRTEEYVVTVKENGVLEIGGSGVDLAGANGRLVLEGGTVKAVASSALSAGGGVQVDGNVTVEVAAGQRLVVADLRGAGTLTKTGTGALFLNSDNPEFSGSVVVADGMFGFFEGATLGAGTLAFGESARLGIVVSADRLVEGGSLAVDLSCLGQVAAIPDVTAFAPNGQTELVENEDYARSVQESVVTLTFPPRVSGRAAWFDYLFDRKSLSEHCVPSRNVANAGYAGESAFLTLDGTWTGETGFDRSTGRLFLKTAPCRDMTGEFSWPERKRWTVVAALQLPAAQNLCLLGVGSTYITTCDYLALATGEASGSLRLVKGHGYAQGETVAEMTLPSASPSAKHLLAITYDGALCKVFHAAGIGEVEEIGSCALADFTPGGGIQVGSLHGGVIDTGLRRADEVPEAESCGIGAVRLFETVLGESALKSLRDELVLQRGVRVIVR